MSEWSCDKLESLVTFQKGKKVVTSREAENGYLRYLGAGALSGKFSEYASPNMAVTANRNDILMLWDGERSGLVGWGLEGVVSSTVSKLVVNKKVEPEFLYNFIFFKFDWIQNRRTGTGIPHVPKDIGRILKVYYPEEKRHQANISAVLRIIDQAIEKTQALIEKYQQIKAGLMHDLFTRGIGADGKLRPPREQAPELYQKTPIGWIPKEWECEALEYGLKSPPKNGFSPREVEDWQSLFVLGLGCLTVNGFSPVQLKNAPRIALSSGAKLEDGDFLISRSNTKDLVGLCGIYRDVGDDAIYPDLMIRLKLNSKLTSEYLEKLLLSKIMRQKISAIAVGTSGSMVKINSKTIRALNISFPTPNEQLEIVARLKPIENNIMTLVFQCQKFVQKKSGLMHDLLTGKVPVPDNLLEAVAN